MAITTPKSVPLIDILMAGYQVLNRCLWVLLIPLALDLYLWLGQPVSFAPLLAPLFDAARRGLAELVVTAGPDQQVAWAALSNEMLALQQADMRGLLVLANWLPTLFTATELARDGSGGYQIDNTVALLATVLLLNLLTLVLSGLFLVPLALAVRHEQATAAGIVRGAARLVRGVASYAALALGGALTLGLPFLILVTLLLLLGPAAAVGGVLLLTQVIWLGLFGIYLYAGFAVEAMLVEGVGPLRALRRSIAMVRQHAWPALSLVLLTLVISQGMLVLWRQLATTPAGTLLAIAGSAYIGGGLAAARLVFYHERAGLRPPNDDTRQAS